ncbi:MAG: M48 family metalloprotease [Gemmatimonadota bacterium]
MSGERSVHLVVRGGARPHGNERRSVVRRNLIPAAVTAISLSLSACATNPATGGSMLSLVSEGQEIEMGQQYRLEVEREQGLYDDSALNAYVDSVGQALAAVSERPDLPWSFAVVDDPVVNAFALPGGPIYLARGIMAHFNSEAELASVLGHEIGHVTARHIVEQMSRQQIAQLGLIASMIAVPDLMPYSEGLSGALGVVFLKFGRDDEAQSDELGFRYMTRLGYDPQGAVDMFEILDRQGEGSGRAIPEWASTHPDPGNRIAAAEERIAKSGLRDGLVRRDEYLQRIQGLVWGEDPREGYFLGQRFLHPELAFQFTLPDGLLKRKSKTAVLAGSPDKDAKFQLTAGSGSPERAAEEFFSRDGIERTGIARKSVNGLPAVVGTWSTTTRQGVIEGIASFVQYGDLTYTMLGYAPSSRVGRYAASMERTMNSFAPLTDSTLLAVEPRRIDLVRVSEAMTAGEFVSRYPSTVEDADVFRINGIRSSDRIEAGTLLKRVTGTGGPVGR